MRGVASLAYQQVSLYSEPRLGVARLGVAVKRKNTAVDLSLFANICVAVDKDEFVSGLGWLQQGRCVVPMSPAAALEDAALAAVKQPRLLQRAGMRFVSLMRRLLPAKPARTEQ